MLKRQITIRFGRRPFRTERGAQLVELAIILPVFLLLIAAIAEFGSYFYTYMTLTKATRVAARHLSSQPFTDDEKTKAKNLAVCGSTTTCASGSAVLKNFSTSNISVTYTGNATIPTTVTVQITGYTYTPVFDLSKLVGGAVWSNVAANPKTTMRYLVWR